MKDKTQFNIWYWVAAFVIMMIFQYSFTMMQNVAQIPYSAFETYLKEGQLSA